MPPIELERRIRQRLEELDRAGLRRRLRPPSGVDFCSNDYLGLAAHPLLKQRMADAVLREGCGSTGSRLVRGEREAFTALERRFAGFKGTEAALYFGSGYAANVGVLATFLEAGDVAFSDERNHASLIDGARLSRARRVIFPHRDVQALRRLLESEACPGKRFVVTESLFSMEGDVAPLAEYAALCRATRTALIVDEAHAVGLYGSHGSGLIEAAGIAGDVFLSVNTAGKALGVAGAFVTAPTWAVEYLVQRARPFIFSTAPPPAVAAALDAALTLVAEEPQRRQRVLDHARLLRKQLSQAGIAVPDGDSPIIPIVLGDNERAVTVAEAIEREGFDVRAIRPPSVPPGTARLRVTVNANHDEAVLHRFASVLAAALEQNLACSAASS